MTLVDGSKGIRVLPPDVNVSDKDFTPVYTDDLFGGGPQGRVANGKGRKSKPKVEGVIRFGLAAVRGVGEKAVEVIAQNRKEKGDFVNLYDFCERIDLRSVSRSTIDALIKCGAFSSTKARRSQLLQILDSAVEMGQQTQSDLRSGQMSMFGGGPAIPSPGQTMGSALPDIEEVDNAELLKFEKELLGFYITSHPLTEQQMVIERYSTGSTRDVMSLGEGTEVVVGGMINRVKKVVTRNGRSAGMQMAIITMEDLDGQIDGTLFAETFAEVNAKYPNAIANESIVFVKGKVDRKRETPSLLVNEVIPLADAITRLTTAIAIKLDASRHSPAMIADVIPLLGKHKGNLPVYFQVNTPTGKVTMQIDRQHAVKPSPNLVGDLEQLLGPGSVDLAGAGSKRKKRLEQQRLFKEEVEETPEAPAALEMDDLES
jgi:DNA polymerase-3 subunit alpha